jgi:hypothetical protein
MKKSQISLVLIIGIVIVMMISFFYIFNSERTDVNLGVEKDKVLELSDRRVNINNYIQNCFEVSAKNAIENFGMRQETLNDLKVHTLNEIVECTVPFFIELENEGYIINSEQKIIDISINDETVDFNLFYPIEFQKSNQKIELDEFKYTYDRSTVIKIPNGIGNKRLQIISTDSKSKLVIQKGTKLFDSTGKIVDEIGVKVEDLHFDGLENSVVLGQVVYNFYPDGTTFSDPVEISIEFDREILPEGVSDKNLKIAYWDEIEGIWKAIDTVIENNIAKAKTDHFTKFQITIGSYVFMPSRRIFEQRFSGIGAVNDFSSDKIWKIGGKVGEDSGTAYVQPNNLPDIKDYRQFLENDAVSVFPLPKIEYGYYEDPLSRSTSNFIDCETDMEPQDNPYEIKTSMLEGLPYYDLFYDCMYDTKCLPCDDESSLNIEECSDKKVCEEIDNDYYCKPLKVNKEKEYSEISCCKERKPDSGNERKPDSVKGVGEESKVFGWHNYQCAGGRVRPNSERGEVASDILMFAHFGNSVIQGLDVFSYQNSLMNFDFSLVEDELQDLFEDEVNKKLRDLNSGDITIKEIFDDVFYEVNSIYFNDDNKLVYYCDVLNFPEGDKVRRISYVLNDDQIKLIKERKYTPGLNVPVYVYYGMYGADIIRDTSMPKNEMSGVCDIGWLFWGSGYIETAMNYDHWANNKDDYKII